MSRPCNHPKFTSSCRVCWLYVTNSTYRAYWDGDISASNKRKERCIHLATVKERKDKQGNECNCDGKWLYNCDVFGTCTRVVKRDGVANCEDCREYQAPGDAFNAIAPVPDKPGVYRVNMDSVRAGAVVQFETTMPGPFGATIENNVGSTVNYFCEAPIRPQSRIWYAGSLSPACFAIGTAGSDDSCCRCPDGISIMEPILTDVTRDENDIIFWFTYLTFTAGCLADIGDPIPTTFSICDVCPPDCGSGTGITPTVPPVTTFGCCSGIEIPGTLRVTLTGTGDLAFLSGSYTVTYSDSLSQFEWVGTVGSVGIQINVICAQGPNIVVACTTGTQGSASASSDATIQCSPFYFTATGLSITAGDCWSSGTLDAVVDEGV